jgi:hypothetical protein
MRISLLVLLTVLGGYPGIAGAQTTDRVRLGISGGLRIGSQTVSQTLAITKNVEPTTIDTAIDVSGGPFFDGGGWFRMSGPVWVGVSVSYATLTADGDVSGQIPHPLYFDARRTLAGTARGLAMTETAVHLGASYVARVSNALDVTIVGGPSYFRVTQDLITDVIYTEAYPYDTVTLTSTPSTNASGTVWGYHAGLDVGWNFSRHAGIGGLLRFAKGSTTIEADGTNTADIDAGGIQAGAGLRVRF